MLALGLAAPSFWSLEIRRRKLSGLFGLLCSCGASRNRCASRLPPQVEFQQDAWLLHAFCERRQHRPRTPSLSFRLLCVFCGPVTGLKVRGVWGLGLGAARSNRCALRVTGRSQQERKGVLRTSLWQGRKFCDDESMLDFCHRPFCHRDVNGPLLRSGWQQAPKPFGIGRWM